MERLQTVKTWSLSALASRLFDWAFDIEVREVLDQKKRSHCCFTVTKPRQPLALDITVIARGGSDLPQRGQFHVL
jgi:hypothetical protein